MTNPRTVAIIVAAGRGDRAGGSGPKQYARLGGRRVIDWSIAAFASHSAVDTIVVVTAPGDEAPFPVEIVRAIGGATRRESVASGLAAAGTADRVLIHDAARPFVPSSVIDRLLAALDTYDGAVPVLPVIDTIAAGTDTLGAIVPRDALNRIQTPQAFALAPIRAAHAGWTGDATDDSQMLRTLGGSVALVQGDAMLDKITWPADFALAEARLAGETRVATGYDVHRLEDGEELWLGGVRIPHTQGLSGHSDADVALHALTDAILGTIAAGDIGTHFPPSDPQWRGAASAQFLEHAVSLLRDRGGRATFVDLTLICEMPRIGPYRAAMQARIGELCGVGHDRVSIKATSR